MPIQFMDFAHQNMFRMIRSQFPDTVRKNKDISIVAYVMAGNEDIRTLINPFVNWEDGTLLYEKMLDHDNGQNRDILKIVAELYSDHDYVSLNSLVQIADNDLFELFLAAIRLKRNGFGDTEYVLAENSMIIK